MLAELPGCFLLGLHDTLGALGTFRAFQMLPVHMTNSTGQTDRKKKVQEILIGSELYQGHDI